MWPMSNVLDYFQKFWNYRYVTSSGKVSPSTTPVKRKTPRIRVEIPTQPKNYIERTLMIRNNISGIFYRGLSLPDIFIFEGIHPNELSKMAENELTGTTTDQLNQDEIIFKFMVLDEPKHFDLICAKINKLAPNVSIHQLRRLDCALTWVKSIGEVRDLLHYADAYPYYNDEDEGNEKIVFDKIITSRKRNHPFCVTGCAGSGKSTLLAGFAHKLANQFPERHVIFRSARNFIRGIKKAQSKSTGDPIMDVLEKACKCDEGRSGLKSQLDSESIKVELLLDGLDEVISSDLKFTLEILKSIKSKYTTVRLWLTTRPYLVNELEMALDIPFQGYALDELWGNETESICSHLSETNIEKYFDKTPENLRLGCMWGIQRYSLQDIRRNPQECQTMAEVIKAELLVTDQPRWSVLLPEYFTRTVERKFQKYESLHGKCSTFIEKEEMLLLLAGPCFKKCFPEYFKKLFPLPQSVSITEEILKVGIVEKVDREKIVMREGFEEFIMAWYILQRMERGSWDAILSDLIVNGIIASKLRCEWNRSVSCELLSTLLNYLLGKYKSVPVDPTHFLDDEVKSKVYIVAEECTQRNLRHLFHCFNQIGKHSPFYPHQAQRVLLRVIENGSLSFVNDVLRKTENLGMSFDKNAKLELLDKAFRRGKFSIVDYITKRLDLLDLLQAPLSETNGINFMHSCIERTEFISDLLATEKIQLIRLLAKLNPSILKTKVTAWFYSSPRDLVLCRYVKVGLLLELIDLGADVLATNEKGETILHMNSRMPIKDYQLLLRSIPDDKLRQLVTVKDAKGETALVRWVKKGKVNVESLSIFHKFGADFKAVDEHGTPLLTLAEKGIKDEALLSKIKEFGNCE